MLNLFGLIFAALIGGDPLALARCLTNDWQTPPRAARAHPPQRAWLATLSSAAPPVIGKIRSTAHSNPRPAIGSARSSPGQQSAPRESTRISRCLFGGTPDAQTGPPGKAQADPPRWSSCKRTTQTLQARAPTQRSRRETWALRRIRPFRDPLPSPSLPVIRARNRQAPERSGESSQHRPSWRVE